MGFTRVSLLLAWCEFAELDEPRLDAADAALVGLGECRDVCQCVEGIDKLLVPDGCLRFTAVGGDVGNGTAPRCGLRGCLGLLALRGRLIHLRLGRLIRANELAVLFEDGP